MKGNFHLSGAAVYHHAVLGMHSETILSMFHVWRDRGRCPLKPISPGPDARDNSLRHIMSSRPPITGSSAEDASPNSSVAKLLTTDVSGLPLTATAQLRFNPAAAVFQPKGLETSLSQSTQPPSTTYAHSAREPGPLASAAGSQRPSHRSPSWGDGIPVTLPRWLSNWDNNSGNKSDARDDLIKYLREQTRYLQSELEKKALVLQKGASTADLSKRVLEGQSITIELQKRQLQALSEQISTLRAEKLGLEAHLSAAQQQNQTAQAAHDGIVAGYEAQLRALHTGYLGNTQSTQRQTALPPPGTPSVVSNLWKGEK